MEILFLGRFEVGSENSHSHSTHNPANSARSVQFNGGISNLIRRPLNGGSTTGNSHEEMTVLMPSIEEQDEGEGMSSPRPHEKK